MLRHPHLLETHRLLPMEVLPRVMMGVSPLEQALAIVAGLALAVQEAMGEATEERVPELIDVYRQNRSILRLAPRSRLRSQRTPSTRSRARWGAGPDRKTGLLVEARWSE